MQHVTTQHSIIQHDITRHTQHSTIQHDPTQHSIIQHDPMQHSTAQHNTARTIQHITIQHNTARTTQHNTIRHNTTRRNATQQKTCIRLTGTVIAWLYPILSNVGWGHSIEFSLINTQINQLSVTVIPYGRDESNLKGNPIQYHIMQYNNYTVPLKNTQCTSTHARHYTYFHIHLTFFCFKLHTDNGVCYNSLHTLNISNRTDWQHVEQRDIQTSIIMMSSVGLSL